MGRSPTKAKDNIYCQCRLEAAKYDGRLRSREGAAELLGLSFSTLSDYELGNTKIVPADNLQRMADLYNAPELKNYYCKNVCPLGTDVPEIRTEDFDRTTIKALSTFGKMQWVKDTLLTIAEDGQISDDEQPEFLEILDVLDELLTVIMQIKHFAKKNGLGGDGDGTGSEE